MGIKRQDWVSKLQVLERSCLPSIESLLIQCQQHLTGHVRMTDSRIPKTLLYGQLKEDHCKLGRPCKSFKDTLKTKLKACDTDITSWETNSFDCSPWRTLCSSGMKTFENKRTLAIKEKSNRRKQGSTSGDVLPCNTCGKCSTSRIGLFSYMRAHTDR